MKTRILILTLCLPWVVVTGQDYEEKRSGASTFFSEFFDLAFAGDMLTVNRLSDVINQTAGTGNKELRDSIDRFRQISGIDAFILSSSAGDHIWSRILNRKDFQRKQQALEHNPDTPYIDFYITFIPVLNNHRNNGFNVHINSMPRTGLFTGDTEVQRINELMNGYVQGLYQRPQDAPVNKACCEGLNEYLRLSGKLPGRFANYNMARADFTAHPSQTYGTDLPRYTPLTGNYESITVSGKHYPVPWKSVETGRNDNINIHIRLRDTSCRTEYLKLTGDDGSEIPLVSADTLQTLTIGSYSKRIDAVYMPDDTTRIPAGAINIAAYDKLLNKVYVIPVDGSFTMDAGRLQQYLNTTYSAAVAGWTVELRPAMNGTPWDSDADNKLDDGSSGLLSCYTAEMRSIIRAYTEKEEPDKNSCYIFLVRSSKSGSLRGFMPRKRQFGFIFIENNSSPQQLYKTIAHELGHGAFILAHIFDEYPSLAPGTTNNLMDYNDSSALYKYQWDIIHNPLPFISWLQDDEEGAMINVVRLMTKIKTANSKEEHILSILKDQCPNVCFKNVTLENNKKLDLLQINCSERFMNKTIEEGRKTEFISFKTSGNDVLIAPSEKDRLITETSAGRVCYYRFHEVKQSPPPRMIEQTNKFLFEFAVLQKDMEAFEEYLFPYARYEVTGVPFLSQANAEETKAKTGCTTGCCKACAEWMVEQKGVTVNHYDRIYLAEAVNYDDLSQGIVPALNDQQFAEAVNYIKSSLKKGKPVMIGTWDSREFDSESKRGPKAWNSKLTGSNNSPTMHFMTIVGYGYDKNSLKYYFRFYDPARDDSENSKNINNRLFINYFTREITNNYRNKNYVISECRKNIAQ